MRTVEAMTLVWLLAVAGCGGGGAADEAADVAAPTVETLPREDLDTPTAPVVVGDVSIPVYNGTPVLNRLLSWGLGRFQAAELAAPTITSVTFTRFSDFCDGAWAQVRSTPAGSELALCFR